MTAGAFRPVQFLGNKTRSIEPVAKAILNELSQDGAVWDAFSGSTVVAQAIAARNRRVVATDALACSATFGRALLGDGSSPVEAGAVIEAVVEESRNKELSDHWAKHLAAEKTAIDARDGLRLLTLGSELPQRWRPHAADRRLQSLFGAVDAAALHENRAIGLLSTSYAGTYFGVQQAVRLEALEAAATEMLVRNDINRWVHAVLLTAICSAASTAAFSAGKHFAQPHRTAPGKPLDFHAKRCLADRSVNVDDDFVDAAKRIFAEARPVGEAHRSYCRPVETVTRADVVSWGAGAIYADPPYTAQQYSRYYHVLDVIVGGVPPRLQQVRGRITQGLYPDSKYHSPFCSRRMAPEAFRQLAEVARDSGARLVVSYSASLSGETGNARTLSLEQLKEILTHVFGSRRVSVEQLALRYRQFNRSENGRAERDDPEFLLVGGVDAA